MADAADSSLLGGLTPAAFLRRHWQKRALLVREAIPRLRRLRVASANCSRSLRATTSSRASCCASGGRWSTLEGPFRKSRLAATAGARIGRCWCTASTCIVRRRRAAAPLRVHSVRAPRRSHGELRRAGRRRRARISIPTTCSCCRARGGGAGASAGSAICRCDRGMPLKILARFRPDSELDARPGRHALPAARSRARRRGRRCLHDLLDRLSRAVGAGTRHCVSRLAARQRRARRTLRRSGSCRRRASRRASARACRRSARAMLGRIRWDRRDRRRFLGCYLTEPKPHVCFDRPRRPLTPARFALDARRRGVRLDARTQLLYDAPQCVHQRRCDRVASRRGRRRRRLANQRAAWQAANGDRRAGRTCSIDGIAMAISTFE